MTARHAAGRFKKDRGLFKSELLSLRQTCCAEELTPFLPRCTEDITELFLAQALTVSPAHPSSSAVAAQTSNLPASPLSHTASGKTTWKISKEELEAAVEEFERRKLARQRRLGDGHSN